MSHDGVDGEDRSTQVDVVLVGWTVDASALDEREENFPDLPADTPGLIREDLYRLVGDESDGVVRLLRVGRWKSREYFYAALGEKGVRPHTAPARMPYEVEPRTREWLSFVRDDTREPDDA